MPVSRREASRLRKTPSTRSDGTLCEKLHKKTITRLVLYGEPTEVNATTRPQLDEPTWPPILLSVCETEPEEVGDQERQHRQPRVGQIQLTMQQSREPTMTITTRFFFLALLTQSSVLLWPSASSCGEQETCVRAKCPKDENRSKLPGSKPR